jgi:tetratricopeptide (TPR) repeat protein
MKQNFVLLTMLGIFSALLSVPALGQTATVKGVCKDSQGTPIADAQVAWHNDDNGRLFNLKTNKKGEYFSLGVDPGKYTVTLSKDGKQLDSQKKVVTSDEITLDFDEKQAQEQAIQDTAKKQGMTPEQVKQMQEAKAKAESYNANIKAINEKFNAANAALKDKQYDTAIAALNETTQMAPNEDLVWYRLGAAYLDSAKAQTDPAEKTRRYTEAYNDIQKAIDLKKNAMQSATQQPAQGGKPPAQGAVSDNARMAAYYDNLASAAAKVGKNDEAEQAYNQAAQLDPANAGQYYYNLGAVLTNANMSNDANIRKQAIEAFDKAIAANPNDPRVADAYYWKAQNLIGMATMQNNKMVAPEGTAEAFKKYLELQPSGPHAEEAKTMLGMIGSTIETTYGNKKKK